PDPGHRQLTVVPQVIFRDPRARKRLSRSDEPVLLGSHGFSASFGCPGAEPRGPRTRAEEPSSASRMHRIGTSRHGSTSCGDVGAELIAATRGHGSICREATNRFCSGPLGLGALLWNTRCTCTATWRIPTRVLRSRDPRPEGPKQKTFLPL